MVEADNGINLLINYAIVGQKTNNGVNVENYKNSHGLTGI
jgi:hypothetical protein